MRLPEPHRSRDEEVDVSAEGESDTRSSIPVDPRDQLVLDEARRSIDQQKKDLEGLRTRATATIGFSTIAASVIGGLSLRGASNLTAWTWGAFACLVMVALLSVYILLPRTLTLVMDGKVMDSWIDKGDDISHMMRSTSLGYDAEYTKNDVLLRRMHSTYAASILVVLVEVTLLFIDLARR
jgi:hypothetical protein